jgi:hypothetical protein
MRSFVTVMGVCFWMTVAMAVQPSFAETWTCSLKERTQSGFVADTVTVARIDDSNAMKVKDAVIGEYRSGWLRGKIDYENSRRITFTWQLSGVRNPPTERGSNTTNLVYSLTVQKNDGSSRMNIQSFPGGTFVRPSFSGTGQCILTK